MFFKQWARPSFTKINKILKNKIPGRFTLCIGDALTPAVGSSPTLAPAAKKPSEM